MATVSKSKAPKAPDRIDDVLVAAATLHGFLTIPQVAKAAGVSKHQALVWLYGLFDEKRLKLVMTWHRGDMREQFYPPDK